MLYEFKSYDGQIELYENKIVIRRKGFARGARGAACGDKEIYLKSISGIQVKRPGMQAGYIQFIFSGSSESKKSSISKVARDENTVMFQGGEAKYQEALKLKMMIEQLTQQPSGGQAFSEADELEKFKKLLDAGAITEDEYFSAKRKLLDSYGIPSMEKSMDKNAYIPDSSAGRQSCSQLNDGGSSKNGLRTSMKVWMIICLIFASLYMLIGAVNQTPAMGIAIFCFFGVLAVMFFVLAKSPKGNPFILGRANGIKKIPFVLSCILIAFVLFGVVTGTSSSSSASQEDNQEEKESVSEVTEQSNIDAGDTTSETTTLSDIQTWYDSQLPGVSQLLIEYAQSVEGLSNMNITESTFHFGEDFGWYDCHYTLYFTCKIDGTACTGEARGFLKYQDTTLNWFHFEIFRDSDWATIVEHYDDSYDQIIEDYYKELEEQYG